MPLRLNASDDLISATLMLILSPPTFNTYLYAVEKGLPSGLTIDEVCRGVRCSLAQGCNSTVVGWVEEEGLPLRLIRIQYF